MPTTVFITEQETYFQTSLLLFIKKILLTMKRLLLICGLCLPFFLSAQHFEAGVLLGVSTYDGDLMPTKIKPLLKESHFAGGGFVRYNINDFVAARLSVNYAKVSGDDANMDNGLQDRNLQFSSTIIEAGLMGEFNILGYQPYALQRIFSPYIFAGIVGYKFNPRTEYNGEMVDLQPLGTEGQGLELYPDRDFYKLTQHAVPIGAGVKIAINDAINIGLEVGARLLFTDYIDDVSKSYADADAIRAARGEIAADLSDRRINLEPDTNLSSVGRGNEKARDWYYITGVTLSYNFLDNGLSGNRRRGKRGLDCFSF